MSSTIEDKHFLVKHWPCLWLISLALLLCPTIGFAQKVLSFNIQDAQSKQGLPFATLYSPTLKKGISSDLKGQAEFPLNAPLPAFDTLIVIINATGYLPETLKIAKPKKFPVPTFWVNMKNREQAVVRIVAKKSDYTRDAKNNQMSVEYIDAQTAKELPSIGGEVDLLRTIALKPGASNAGDAATGLYIRGGGPDQNLITLNDAVIYNPNHLFGFFSVFNADALAGVEMHKGAFPARTGGRLSSIVNIKTRAPNMDSLTGNVSVGAISTKASIDIPIIKGRSALFLGGRRTYFDVFSRAINRLNENTPNYDPIPDYYFYDFNAQYNHTMNERESWSASAYFGRDIFAFQKDGFEVNTRWGNQSATLHYNYQPRGSETKHKYSLLYSGYQYQTGFDYDNFQVTVGSQINDISTNALYTRKLGNRMELNYGYSLGLNSFVLGRSSGGNEDANINFSSGKRLVSLNAGFFAENNWDISERTGLIAGLRYSAFRRGENSYTGWEPRLSFRHNVNSTLTLRAAYARMFQYLHLLSSSGASLPSDMYFPSGNRVAPQVSDQVTLGYQLDLGGNNEYVFSNELYYKNMNNQTDFKDGTNLFTVAGLDSSLVFGRGWAYGSEFYIEKKKGKLQGWIGYTLSWSWRQFPDINQGRKFNPRYDRRHDISIVAIYKFNKRLSASSTFVFGTGNNISLPEGRAFFQDIPGTVNNPPGYDVIPEISRRNAYRMPAYHRLDIGITYKMKVARGSSEWNFSIYNVYNRRNPYFFYFETQFAGANNRSQITGFNARQVSLMPIIPSLSYSRRW